MKSYFLVKRETKLLSLYHTDLGDLEQIMTRGDKIYYVIDIDFCIFTNLYIHRNKNNALNAFISYKTKLKINLVENSRVLDLIELGNIYP